MSRTLRCLPEFFFQHQLIDEDWSARPDFLDQFDAKTACGLDAKPTPSTAPKKCGGQQYVFTPSGARSYNEVMFLCINFIWMLLF
jgi:hypothetical protein